MLRVSPLLWPLRQPTSNHGGRRQPMCNLEGCSTVWGAVGGGTPPPFVDPNPAERGTESEVAHKWARWLHNLCRLGDPHRFRAGGRIRGGPQVGKVATEGGTHATETGGFQRTVHTVQGRPQELGALAGRHGGSRRAEDRRDSQRTTYWHVGDLGKRWRNGTCDPNNWMARQHMTARSTQYSRPKQSGVPQQQRWTATPPAASTNTSPPDTQHPG